MWIAKDCAEKNQIHRAIREAKYLRPAGMQLMVTSRFLAVLAVLVAWRQVSHWGQEFEKAQAQRDAFRRFGQPGRWFPMGDETQRGKGGKGNFINHQSSKMDGRFTMVYHPQMVGLWPCPHWGYVIAIFLQLLPLFCTTMRAVCKWKTLEDHSYSINT